MAEWTLPGTRKFAAGETVIYRSHPGATPEQGTVVSANAAYAFVHYDGDPHDQTKATRHSDLVPFMDRDDG